MTISEAPRHVRRAAYAAERAERASGDWSYWKRADADQMAAAWDATMEACPVGGLGWTREMHTVWTNGWLCVMVRTLMHTSLGFTMDHCAMRTALGAELRFAEKQRVKDEIFGEDRMAVEVFPRTGDLVDAANMFHLWVFPAGYRFDFGLATGQL